MKVLNLFVILLLQTICYLTHSQSTIDYSLSSIPDSLKNSANAVVRFEKIHLDIKAYNKINVTTHRVVTIFNDYGERHKNAIEFYDRGRKINFLEARIYDVDGKEIKRIKEKDFVDESAVSGGTLYSDDMVKYLNYTTGNYPYTVSFKSSVSLSNTAFIPSWQPIDDYYLSVQYSEFQISNNSGVELRTKSERFENFNITEKGNTHFVAENVPGLSYEAYNPGIRNIIPLFSSALGKFSMEGVDGINNNWNDFGKWMYDKLLTDTIEIPEEEIQNIRQLTDSIDGNIEKAKVVYKYMQNKTRYISVQIGIGGWKPSAAEDVVRLGYSDCKGLTNYTRALLNVIGVPSYYTVVWGGSDIKNMDRDFSRTEGNHVILCLPIEEENIFLECTSQTNPFGFIAGFTDDRDVLLVTPDGGKIVHTNKYDVEESRQITKAQIEIDMDGGFTANTTRNYLGYQYALNIGLTSESPKEHIYARKEEWGYINGLSIEKLKVSNNTDDIKLTEEFEVIVPSYASKSGNRLILQPNVFNRMQAIPPRYIDRKLEFNIQRPYKDVDTYIISIPENYEIEAMNEGDEIETDFGKYSYHIEKINDRKIEYKRNLEIYNGMYSKEQYKDFRDFYKRINKLDKAKIVLKQK